MVKKILKSFWIYLVVIHASYGLSVAMLESLTAYTTHYDEGGRNEKDERTTKLKFEPVFFDTFRNFKKVFKTFKDFVTT